MQLLKSILIVLVVVGAAGLGFIYSGVYPIGADDHHTRVVHWALETLREQSIARSSRDIQVPPLDDPGLLLSGGADYNEMCARCHLKPGKSESDFSLGLYPSPPNLTVADEDGNGDDLAAERFWIIKHGIKASGMPAWGATHSDERIWAMVAFLSRLPDMTPLQYQIVTARPEADAGHAH